MDVLGPMQTVGFCVGSFLAVRIHVHAPAMCHLFTTHGLHIHSIAFHSNNELSIILSEKCSWTISFQSVIVIY